MDAPRRIPHILARNVLDPKDPVLIALHLALPQVLALPQHVLTHRLVVLHRLLHDHRLRKLTLKPLIVNRHRRPIQHPLLPIPKPMPRLPDLPIPLPIVIPLLLLPRRKIAMRLLIHLSNLPLLLLIPIHRIQNILSILTTNSRYTKLKLI